MKPINILIKIPKQALITFFITGLLVSGCSESSDSEKKKKSRPHKVETITTDYEKVSIERKFNAVIHAPQTVRISSQVAGTIIKLPFREGSIVKKGDLLVQLDDSLTKAEFNKAKASFDKANLDLKRLQNLNSKKLISDEELAVASTELKLAEAEVTLKRTRLKQSSILAPFNGVISQRNHEPNDTASVNSHILTLVNNTQLIAKTSIPEALLASVKTGNTGKVMIPSLSLELDSKIKSIYPTVNPETQQVTIELSLATNNQTLFPGQFAQAVIQTTPENLILIPVNAVQYDTKGAWVFLADNNKAKIQRITEGRHFDNKISVSKGLSPGQVIIIRGFVGLKNNKPIKIINALSNKKEAH